MVGIYTKLWATYAAQTRQDRPGAIEPPSQGETIMSAFIVGTDHIDYLVSAAVDVGTNGGGFGIYWGGERIDWESATRVGAALLAENIASVAYRYAGSDPGWELPGPIPTPSPEEYEYQPFLTVEPAQVLKALDCYESQSCEHPGWQESDARRFCDALRRRYSAMMPGYEDALWEVSRAELMKRAMRSRRPGEAMPLTPDDPEQEERQDERRRVYMSALVAQLEERAREHGHAYVTPQEGAWLTANDLRQPGHTVHRFSTPGEDLSDATQAAMDERGEG